MTSDCPSPQPNQPLSEVKRALRITAQEARAALHDRLSGSAPQRLCAHALPFLPDAMPDTGRITVSGFFPIRSEIDVRPLLAALAGQGHRTALPVVIARDRPLVFREWSHGDPLDEGWGGIGEPPDTAPEVVPDVLLVPLLQVDATGFRLGYGAGHYDRTIAQLRRSGPALAVGVCYAGQRVDQVPREPHDLPLDWLLTEEGVNRFEPAGDALDRLRR